MQNSAYFQRRIISSSIKTQKIKFLLTSVRQIALDDQHHWCPRENIHCKSGFWSSLFCYWYHNTQVPSWHHRSTLHHLFFCHSIIHALQIIVHLINLLQTIVHPIHFLQTIVHLIHFLQTIVHLIHFLQTIVHLFHFLQTIVHLVIQSPCHIHRTNCT